MAGLKSYIEILNRYKSIIAIVFAVLLVGVFLFEFVYGRSSVVDLAEFIASKIFILIYATLLIAITLTAIISAERKVAREWGDVPVIIGALNDNNSAEPKLALLNRLTDARIATNDMCRDQILLKDERSAIAGSSIRRSVGIFLGCVTSVPPTRHSLEGLRPAEDFLAIELRKRQPRLVALGDTVIRLALLGTFAGLIAALTIASANVGIMQPTEQAQTEVIQKFVQQLLASAATKFWISAIGIACALVLRFWQNLLYRKLDRIAAELGLAFDTALAKPEITSVWCAAGAELDPTGPMKEIVNQIRSQPQNWVLSLGSGAASTAKPAQS